MNVLVLHNQIDEQAGAPDQDTLAQRDAVVAALQRQAHDVTTCACSLDLDALRQRLVQQQPDVVFNLVESLGGTDRLMVLPTLLLESLCLPFTGVGSAAILASANKLSAKRRMVETGLPTPAWIEHAEHAPEIANGLAGAVRDGDFVWGRPASSDPSPESWIVKPVWEHASVGMDDDAVIEAAETRAVARMLDERNRLGGRPLFAERFIAGREFNLSLLNGCVLPPAEMDFAGYPADKPRIVGYRAKWDETSFEFRQTRRRFDFPSNDRRLLGELQRLARRCWQAFAFRGYARVDFRVDPNGRPWILEINANPCLTHDAGFAAALQQAGIDYALAIDGLLQAALVDRAMSPLGAEG